LAFLVCRRHLKPPEPLFSASRQQRSEITAGDFNSEMGEIGAFGCNQKYKFIKLIFFNDRTDFHWLSLTLVHFPDQYQIQWIFKSRAKFNNFSTCVWALTFTSLQVMTRVSVKLPILQVPITYILDSERISIKKWKLHLG